MSKLVWEHEIEAGFCINCGNRSNDIARNTWNNCHAHRGSVLKAALHEAHEVLRKVQWSFNEYPDYMNQCPLCKGYQPKTFHTSIDVDTYQSGHTPDCRLAAVLGPEGA